MLLFQIVALLRGMAKSNPHTALVDAIPRDALIGRFALSRQNLHYWRFRGVPASKRIAFARLASDYGVPVPQSFFDEVDK